MNLNRWSAWLHKWIGLVVAVQVLIWVGGGLVMVALPIEQVRGEHRVAEIRPPRLDPSHLISAADAADAAGFSPIEARLVSTPRGPVWIVQREHGQPRTLSALTGAPPSAMTEQEARLLAQAAYRGPGRVEDADLLSEAPQETRHEGPVWRVAFSDPEATRLYLDPITGAVVSRRSDLWSFYDLMWRLHILDLESGEDTNHPLLVALTAAAFVMAITGLILLWIRLARDLRNRRRRSAGRS